MEAIGDRRRPGNVRVLPGISVTQDPTDKIGKWSTRTHRIQIKAIHLIVRTWGAAVLRLYEEKPKRKWLSHLAGLKTRPHKEAITRKPREGSTKSILPAGEQNVFHADDNLFGHGVFGGAVGGVFAVDA
jgi:hypothetical protein